MILFCDRILYNTIIFLSCGRNSFFFLITITNFMEWKFPYKQLFCFDLFSVQYNKEETFTIRIWLKRDLCSMWSRATDTWTCSQCFCIVIYFFVFQKPQQKTLSSVWLSGACIWAIAARACFWGNLISKEVFYPPGWALWWACISL